MTRDELIKELLKHRNNDVKVIVPCESGKTIDLAVYDIHYGSYMDAIVIQTEEHLDLE